MVIIQRLIARHLPTGIKRLLCLSTLGYRINQLSHQQVNRTYFSKVNSLLDLAENEGALRFAVCYTNYFWHNLTNIDLNNLDQMVRDLYEKLPNYLKYREQQVVEAEMKKVILSFA
jgi:hypothetical protein|nr:MAG TPA: hypothetical protein [Caudoviricetes sp.]